MRIKTYTVIGYYQDNDQPFSTVEKALNPHAAAVMALTRLKEENESSDPAVVDVIAGEHKSLLGNDKILKCFDVLGR